MKITPQVAQILSAAQFFADEPVAQVAKRLSMPVHTVRRVIDASINEGVLRRRVYFNYFRLGCIQYSIYLNVRARSLAQRERARQILVKAPFVELVLELGATYDFAIVLTARSALDVEVFFEFLHAKQEIELEEVNLHARTGWYYFGVKYLSSQKFSHSIEVIPGQEKDLLKLDSEDWDVLDAFQMSSDGNRQRMAKSLGMPLSTFQYRIDKLIRSGAILGTLFQIVADSIKYQAFRVLASTRFPLARHRSLLLNWARKNPYILTFMHGVGKWDYELRIETHSPEVVREVVDELLEIGRDFIESAEIVPVTKILKMSLCPDRRLFDPVASSKA